ncbi:MAG: BlaI/MecI/CopY family transcriptional regulator [Chlorobi bacterium]|nr:BlaI/MecI/CopY family transcriptional regulator [Chlorobiota bacterium]
MNLSIMKTLTRAEEQIIRILWELGKASVKQIRERMPDPKPAVNTVSTIVRILENKGFVSHEKQGRGYVYYPLVRKEEYTRFSLRNLVNHYFDGSFKNLVSFFARQEDLDVHELEEILNELRQKRTS